MAAEKPDPKPAPKPVDLEEYLVGGNLTPEARAAGLADEDVAGGSFVDPEHAQALLAKANKKG